MKQIWEKKIESLIKTNTETEESMFFHIISLLLYSRENDQLSTLYKEVGKEKFSEIIDSLGGQTIHLPNREEYKDVTLVALCYYLKEIKGRSWKEIHDIIPFDNINSVKYGKWIARLSRDIKSQISEVFHKLETETDIQEFF